MSVLDDAIAAARAELENPPTVTTPIRVADLIVNVVFTKMQPMDWLDLTTTHPPRVGSTRDKNLGFNVHAVVAAAAPLCGKSADGDEITEDQWAGIVSVLDAPDFETIGVALWGLNHFDSVQRTERVMSAPKGSPRKSRRKPV